MDFDSFIVDLYLVCAFNSMIGSTNNYITGGGMGPIKLDTWRLPHYICMKDKVLHDVHGGGVENSETWHLTTSPLNL